MKRKDNLTMVPLLLAFIFGGAFVLKGLHFRSVKSAVPRTQTPSVPPMAIKAISSQTQPKRTQNIRPASKFVGAEIRRNPTGINRILPTQQKPLRQSYHISLYPNHRSPASESESAFVDDVSRELQDIDYQDRMENDFLTKKVGLTEEQIQVMEEKRKDYLARLQAISQQEIQGDQVAPASKRTLIQSHLQWMMSFLGPENYYEYLSITAQ